LGPSSADLNARHLFYATAALPERGATAASRLERLGPKDKPWDDDQYLMLNALPFGVQTAGPWRPGSR
jgi:hypothetical protein